MHTESLSIENKAESLYHSTNAFIAIVSAVFIRFISSAVGGKGGHYLAIFGLLFLSCLLMFSIYKLKKSPNSSVLIENDDIEFYSDGELTSRIRCADIQLVTISFNISTYNRIWRLSWIEKLPFIIFFFYFIPIFIFLLLLLTISKILYKLFIRRDTLFSFFDVIVIECENDSHVIWAPEKISTQLMKDKLMDISSRHGFEVKRALPFMPNKPKKRQPT